jgi:hypothetical protein
MKKLKSAGIIMVIVSFFFTSAWARDAQDITKSGPCRADITKFCKNVRPGKGRVLRCMRQYENHISDVCKNHIAEVREKTHAFARACRDDRQKFCRDVRPGDGAVYRCLQQHQAELSAVCNNQVK